MDGPNGNSSYLIDFPNGGKAVPAGNILRRRPMAENWAVVSFSAESRNRKSGDLLIMNNTLFNDRNSGIFISIATAYARVHVQNNIFLGAGEISNQEIRRVSNIVVKSASRWPFNG